MSLPWLRWQFWAIATALMAWMPRSGFGEPAVVTASSVAGACAAAGAFDGNRFSVAPESTWKGAAGAGLWWWQVRFPAPRRIGAILQIIGDHDFVLGHAPRRYAWQGSQDGVHWQEWPETAIEDEQRLFRLHRLRSSRQVQFARMRVAATTGDAPVIREIEFYDEPAASVVFPSWILVVNTTHDPALPGEGQGFIPLARSCPGWSQTPAQQVWLPAFDLALVTAEPRPLCAFLSGNFKDWCEVDRRHWRGTQAVLTRGTLPLWASCGGAQGLALLSEYGAERPWDCPHCRDPSHPRTPLYGHLGHTATRPCGDYTGCIFERGPHSIRFLQNDPAFAGLPAEATLMESHCGQIEWTPRGWTLIATAGADTQTKVQCLRRVGLPIYAAQFHIEMAGTLETSRRIMANFLGEAMDWQARPDRLPENPRRGR